MCAMYGTEDTLYHAGDEEARHRGTQKSVLERKGPATFPVVIEMRERAFWVSHWTEESVDLMLLDKDPIVQVILFHPFLLVFQNSAVPAKLAQCLLFEVKPSKKQILRFCGRISFTSGLASRSQSRYTVSHVYETCHLHSILKTRIQMAQIRFFPLHSFSPCFPALTVSI